MSNNYLTVMFYSFSSGQMVLVYATEEQAEVVHCNQTKLIRTSVVEVESVIKSTRLTRTELSESANIRKLTNIRI